MDDLFFSLSIHGYYLFLYFLHVVGFGGAWYLPNVTRKKAQSAAEAPKETRRKPMTKRMTLKTTKSKMITMRVRRIKKMMARRRIKMMMGTMRMLMLRK